MYRVGILLKDGNTISNNCEDRESADIWVLEQCEKYEVKKVIIANKDNIKDREIINF